jgi:CRISPR-associated endonuclease/helicase Cas3
MELLKLWGKSDKTTKSSDFHPLAYHILDVAACAEALLKADPYWLEKFSGRAKVPFDHLLALVVSLIALHDIGKCARGFQAKVPELWPATLGAMAGSLAVRHDAASLWLLTQEPALKQTIAGWLPQLAPPARRTLLQAVCGHHGEPIELTRQLKPADVVDESKQIGKASRDAAVRLADILVGILPSATPLNVPEDLIAELSFLLAGFSVLADWLGSNRTWFAFHAPPQAVSVEAELHRYWNEVAREGARHAIKEAGLVPVASSPSCGFAALFPDFAPTNLQSAVRDVDLPQGPVLAIVEDMTGAGKTEAAIFLAHRLIASGQARGIYAALPTMATANAMFGRLAKSYRKLFAEDCNPSIVLVHGHRDLHEGFLHLPRTLGNPGATLRNEPDDPSDVTASAYCADWIARSNKQAFLAQVGAGTIDQALLSVLPARHQALRLWGLADKVLIIDEAHAYDPYMETELQALLRFHASLCGSAIILSATLPAAKRLSLLAAFRNGLCEHREDLKLQSSAYPLLTLAAASSVTEHPLVLREGLCREVKVIRAGNLDTAHAAVLAAAQGGASVALIRNTVDEAIASHAFLSSKSPVDATLFHARFAMCDRLAIEEEVLEKFGKTADAEKRRGILVATQIIEQSLDLDFDLIVTDLAPIDLIIQRAGRLWRHMEKRPAAARPNLELCEVHRPALIVVSPEARNDASENWLNAVLPKTGAVYRDAALLWRSANVLFEAGKIGSTTSEALASPGTGEIRALIEAVYGEEAITPVGLENVYYDAEGRAGAERTQARFNVLKFENGYDRNGGRWDADTRIATRLGEETIVLRLARLESGELLPWAEDKKGDRRRAWALSEVTLRAARCSGVAPQGADVERRIAATKRDWSLSEQQMPVLVVAEDATPGCWRGAILDKIHSLKQIVYSKSQGLKFIES